jgi:hypothetical protein
MYGEARQVTDDNIVQRMRNVCWVTKATDTHSEYILRIYSFYAATMVTRTRLNITLYVRLIICCYMFQLRISATFRELQMLRHVHIAMQFVKHKWYNM